MSGPPDQRILVVIPAWNEAGAIAATIAEVRAAQPDVDILVVDDGSGGRAPPPSPQRPAPWWLPARRSTSASAAPCARATATPCGRATTSSCRSTPTASTTPPTSRSCSPGSSDADVVIGARFAGEGELRGPRPTAVGHALLAAVLSRLAGTRLTDVTSGFRVANRRAVARLRRPLPGGVPRRHRRVARDRAARAGAPCPSCPSTCGPARSARPARSPLRAATYLVRAVVALALALVRRWPAATETLGQEK